MKKITSSICFITQDGSEDTSDIAKPDLSRLMSALTQRNSAQNADLPQASESAPMSIDSKMDAKPIYDPLALPEEYKL